MAIFKTPAELRKFELSNGKTVDLIALIGTYKEIMHRETWVNPTVAPEIGTVAYVAAMGDSRRGVVVKTTKTKTHVAITTQGAVDSAAAYETHVGAGRGSQPVRVQVVIADTNYVRVAPAPEPTPAPVEDAPEFNPEAGASAPEANRAATQTGGVEGLTLNSHGGKVDNNSKDEPEGDEMTATTTETAPAKKHTGSAVVQLLERVWDRIRENHPELPQAVIVTGMGADIGGLKWGHFRADGWEVVQAEGAALRMNEMFMAGETLAKGALQVLQTMLHEGAHTLARVREIQDTSRQHRWHNAKFRTLAEEMGLEYPHDKADPKIGFSAVTLTEETKAEYADLIEELDKEISLVISLPGWLGGLGGLLGGLTGGDPLGGDGIKGRPTEPTGNTSTNLKLTCECEEPNIIRASRKVADKMVVNCGDCDALFKVR